MNIYIPNINFKKTNTKSVFILTRPFLNDDKWDNDVELKSKWKVSSDFTYINSIELADVYFIPKPIQHYSKNELNRINADCKSLNIKAYGYIAGDFGEDFGYFENIIFFRMGGFKSQLSQNNKGFPVGLSDHFERIYQRKEIATRQKQELPEVGFCGHASKSFTKRCKENIKVVKENLKRFLQNPLRNDYEPLFPSAYYRAKLLQYLEDSPKIKTNFIYREHYRGGAVTLQQREQTTLEYYDNIKDSDYILCVRGAGNFSVRFYETLLMGRIPIFVNTDCLLPFEDKINWKAHVVWVEWKERDKIADIVADFHNNLTDDAFENLQRKNRKLWKETLSVGTMIDLLRG